MYSVPSTVILKLVVPVVVAGPIIECNLPPLGAEVMSFTVT